MVVEQRLHLLPHRPKDRRHRNVGRAGVAAQPTAHTARHHVVQPRQVEQQRVGQHPHRPLALGPLVVQLRVVVKGRRAEDALLAVADRAVDHAVVAADAGGELGQQAVHGVDPAAELGNRRVAGLGAGGDQLVDGLGSPRRRVARGQVQRLGQVVAGLEVQLARLDADQPDGQRHVLALRQRLLADLAGGAELQPVQRLELARRRPGQDGRQVGLRRSASRSPCRCPGSRCRRSGRRPAWPAGT